MREIPRSFSAVSVRNIFEAHNPFHSTGETTLTLLAILQRFLRNRNARQ